jgi:OmpA-OmpF porin, OOP family
MKNTKKCMFVSVALALLPGIVIAQSDQTDKIQGYLLDSRGAVVKNNYGQCWRTGYWTPAMAIAECDPDLVKKVEAPAPKAVAVAPTPAPVVAALVPAKVAPSKVSLSADALFAFDKSTLKPEGKQELDRLVQDLNGVSYESIHVTGHTDRIGSEKYNQRLSEERANAVRDYLAGKDIPTSRISVEGKGETQPTTGLGDCTGPKSKKLIACLQPDRRVDIEVSGTK